MSTAHITWTRLKRNKLAVAGGILISLLFIIAIFAPIIAPYQPTEVDLGQILQSPSLKHPLGTDDLGRDVLTRMIYGTRISLSVGFVAVGISILIGIIVGSLAGYFGGWIDNVLMRLVDIMLTFPTLFLILAVIAIVDKPSIYTIMIVIGVTSWMDVSRLVRAEFLTLKERDFVHAAKASGVHSAGIIFRHILPNAISPVFVAATFGVAGAILVESALSFLGLGVQPPNPSWGNMLTLGKDNIQIAWWLSVYPGFAILITVLSYNLLGEGMRDALDPRLWQSD